MLTIKKNRCDYQGKKMNQFRFMLTLALLTSLTACLPVYKTIKPQLNVVVVDSQEQPVIGAKLVLTTRAHPTPIHDEDIQYTNAKGSAGFKKEKDMQVQTAFIHGSLQYYWSLCTEKAGYTSVTQSIDTPTVRNKSLIVMLPAGESKSCPSDQQ
jgi:hypothetical protein